MHIPVLQKEVLEYLNPKPNDNFIDATCGGGGHAKAILEKVAPRGKVLGVETDSELFKKLKESNINRLVLVNGSYINLKDIVAKEKFSKIQGVLLDLGMSSWHLAESGRGFSFQKREPLDMRYGFQNQLTAEKIINFWSKFELEKILKEYGEERFAENIAERVVEERKIRPIKTTWQLIEVIRKAVPKRYLYQLSKHFATRTFQALRIAVNDELANLEKVLPQALEVLKPSGKLVIISFHSLEDRIVKNFFRNQAKEGLLEILTKKPISPGQKEIRINPRARSAKLRAAQKL